MVTQGCGFHPVNYLILKSIFVILSCQCLCPTALTTALGFKFCRCVGVFLLQRALTADFLLFLDRNNNRTQMLRKIYLPQVTD